jgi:aldose sugar dehydrogenase
MTKRTIVLSVLVIIVLCLVYVSWYLGFFAERIQKGESFGELPQDIIEVEYIVEEFVSGLHVPWSIVFTSPDRMLVAERRGNLKVVLDGILQNEPIHVFDVSSGGEQGLMGLVLDPEYNSNRQIYLSYAYEDRGNIFVKIVRFRDGGDRLLDERVIMDNIPGARFHAGSRLAFGPDLKLYITTGDALERSIAQDSNSLAGKILRINKDGSIPEDNPFWGSAIWSLGHRNPQGIDWHPVTQEMYSTEHGPSGFDGPGGGDEVNRIVRGGNYGWPLVSHEKNMEGMIAPLLVFTPAEAPASLMFYDGDALPQFNNNGFFGALRGQGLFRFVVDYNNPNNVIFYEKMEEVDFGRIRAITQGIDGYIYFGTSNRDGRGSPTSSDDRIFRIRPK